MNEKKISVKALILTLLVVLVSLFKVLADFLVLYVSREMFTADYWIKLFSMNFIAVVVLFLVMSARIDTQTRKNKKCHRLIGNLDNLFRALTKTGLLTLFKAYISADNDKARRLAYETRLNAKKLRLETKIKKKERKYNVRRLRKKLAVVESPNTFYLSRLRSKLGFVKERISTIEADWQYAKVRYTSVSFKTIFGNGKGRDFDDRDMGEHEGSFAVGVILKKVLSIIMIGVFMSISVYGQEVAWSYKLVYQLALSLFQIGFAVYSGISIADQFVENNRCNALMRRLAYVQTFKEGLPAGAIVEEEEEDEEA